MMGSARDRVARSWRSARQRRRAAGAADSTLPVHHFGTTRFSLFQPTNPAWRLTRRADSADADVYAAKLFSEERMGPRCDIFCDIAAPLYQRMAKGRRYRHLVMYSEVMPQRWKDRLQETAERYPVLWLIESQDGVPDARALLRAHLREHSGNQDGLVFVFRVDDDDLLSVDFLDQVEPYVVPLHHDHVISFSSGYAGLFEQGRYTRAVLWQQRLSSMGQGAIGTWRAREDRLALTQVGNHNRSDRSRTVLLDGRRPSFLQTRHLGQDTAVKESEHIDLERARSRILKELDQQPPVTDSAVLLERFPTLGSRLELSG